MMIRRAPLLLVLGGLLPAIAHGYEVNHISRLAKVTGQDGRVALAQEGCSPGAQIVVRDASTNHEVGTLTAGGSPITLKKDKSYFFWFPHKGTPLFKGEIVNIVLPLSFTSTDGVYEFHFKAIAHLGVADSDRLEIVANSQESSRKLPPTHTLGPGANGVPFCTIQFN